MKKTYTITLKRGSLTCHEEFTGGRLGLIIYILKMRKWKMTIEEKG